MSNAALVVRISKAKWVSGASVFLVGGVVGLYDSLFLKSRPIEAVNTAVVFIGLAMTVFAIAYAIHQKKPIMMIDGRGIQFNGIKPSFVRWGEIEDARVEFASRWPGFPSIQLKLGSGKRRSILAFGCDKSFAEVYACIASYLPQLEDAILSCGRCDAIVHIATTSCSSCGAIFIDEASQPT